MYIMESTTSSSSNDVHIIINPEDEEFEHRLDKELLLGDMDAHSAITMSPENSDIGSCSDSGSGNDSENVIQYKAITFKEVEAKIKREYNDDDMVNEIDILSVYVKNQKNIYTEAKNINNMRLYVLSFPSICISITTSTIAPFIGQTAWGIIIITVLNAVLAVFITLIVILKLETTSIHYEMVASKYGSLQDILDTFSSKIAFISSKHEKDKLIFAKMKKIDCKITEIKEETQVELPNYIRYLYPKISSINIFSSIYSVEMYRKNLINLLKGVINETRFINAKWDSEIAFKKHDPEYMINGFCRVKEQKRLNTLADTKEQLKRDIAKYKNTYSFIDDVFQQEIQDKKNKEKWWLFNLWFDSGIDVNEKILKYD